MKPIEHITWPEMSHTKGSRPPNGHYVVRVKVFSRVQFHRDVNITVVVHRHGKNDMYHQRVTPSCCEVKVCSFDYDGDRHEYERRHGTSRVRSDYNSKRPQSPQSSYSPQSPSNQHRPDRRF